MLMIIQMQMNANSTSVISDRSKFMDTKPVCPITDWPARKIYQDITHAALYFLHGLSDSTAQPFDGISHELQSALILKG